MEFALALYWLAAVLAFAAAVTPLCARLFRGFPGRGAALAPGVGFALLAVVAYWLGRVHWSTGVAALSLLVVVSLGVLASRNLKRPDPRKALPPLAVFAAAFALFVAIRAVDPAAHAGGGEKFLDYGLMKSITLADRLPPEDIWFAGRPVRYYYGGLLSVTAFADAIGVPVRYAYNLGLATCFAALASGAYGVASAVAAHRDRSPALAGVLAALLVCLGGFPATPVRLLAGLLFPVEVIAEHAEWLVAGIRLGDPLPVATDPTAWNYWIARYVVPSTITVNPLWSYLNGDLHAHVIAPVFLLPAVGVAFEAWRTPNRRRRLVLLFLVLPVFAGALAMTSTWSLPTAAGLGFLAVALADHHPRDLLPTSVRDAVPGAGASGELARYALAGLTGVAVALGGVALAAPFFLFYAPENGGVGFLPPRSPLAPYLLVWGGFVAVFATYLARRASLTARQTAAAVVGWAVLLAAFEFVHAASVVVLLPVLAAAWYLRRTDRAGFAAVLVVAGAGILLAVELAYAKVWPHDPTAPRWNTVYKISMQVAVLWGVAGGITAASLLEPVLARARNALASARDTAADTASGAADATPTVSRADALGAVVAVLVVLSAMTFPVFALTDHFGNPPREPRNATLDASEFVEDHHPYEAAAFEWLRQHADGQPTLLTTAGDPIYVWMNAPSTFTGYPTVVGWVHEKGYRGEAAYADRARDVQFMFQGSPKTQALLFDKYDVQYVYYGPLERERYPDAEFGGPGVREVYENPRVTIYAVDADEACAATNLSCYEG